MHAPGAFDLAAMAATGPGFTGAGEVVADGPLTAVVDDLRPRPARVGDAAASITPAHLMQLAWTGVGCDTRGQAITGVTHPATGPPSPHPGRSV